MSAHKLDPIPIRRKSASFKPTLADEELLRKSLSAFFETSRRKSLCASNYTFIWERIPTGFRITDFHTEKIEEILNFLKIYYFCSDQSCARTSTYMDSSTIEKYQQFVMHVVSDSNSFLALEEGTGRIIGVALAEIKMKSHEANENNNDTKKDRFNMLTFEENLLREAKIYDFYKINRYYCIHVLCVEPSFHGNGIGTSLVRSCLKKAQEMNCHVCIGVFPAGSSQTIASKFDFKDLVTVPWTNIKSFKTNNFHNDQDVLENSFVSCMGKELIIDENCDSSSNEEFTEY